MCWLLSNIIKYIFWLKLFTFLSILIFSTGFGWWTWDRSSKDSCPLQAAALDQIQISFVLQGPYQSGAQELETFEDQWAVGRKQLGSENWSEKEGMFIFKTFRKFTPVKFV